MSQVYGDIPDECKQKLAKDRIHIIKSLTMFQFRALAYNARVIIMQKTSEKRNIIEPYPVNPLLLKC